MTKSSYLKWKCEALVTIDYNCDFLKSIYLSFHFEKVLITSELNWRRNRPRALFKNKSNGKCDWRFFWGCCKAGCSISFLIHRNVPAFLFPYPMLLDIITLLFQQNHFSTRMKISILHTQYKIWKAAIDDLPIFIFKVLMMDFLEFFSQFWLMPKKTNKNKCLVHTYYIIC